MVNDSNILAIENIIIEHAGPMGKFVIKKAIVDIDIDLENYDRATLNKFIDLVLQRSIFDTEKWESLRKEILSAWAQ